MIHERPVENSRGRVISHEWTRMNTNGRRFWGHRWGTTRLSSSKSDAHGYCLGDWGSLWRERAKLAAKSQPFQMCLGEIYKLLKRLNPFGRRCGGCSRLLEAVPDDFQLFLCCLEDSFSQGYSDILVSEVINAEALQVLRIRERCHQRRFVLPA